MTKPQVIIARLKGDSIGFVSWNTLDDGPVPRVYALNEHPLYGGAPFVDKNNTYFSMMEKTSGVYQLDVDIALEHGIINRKKLALGSLN